MSADKDSPGYVSSGSFLLSAYQGWLTYYLNIYDIDKKKVSMRRIRNIPGQQG